MGMILISIVVTIVVVAMACDCLLIQQTLGDSEPPPGLQPPSQGMDRSRAP